MALDHGRLRPDPGARPGPDARRRDAGEIRANLDVAAAYLGESAVHEEAVSASAPMLELDEPRGPLRRRAGRSRPVARGRRGRDRRPDRAERRRQVDDAARDHGRSCRPRRATSGSPARRSAAARPRTIARSGVALVPEGRRIFAELTVEENLRLGLAGSPQQRRRRATTSPRSTSCSRSCRSFARRQAGALSGGQQQQLAIAPGARRRRRTCCCSTSPRSGSSPTVVDIVFEALRAIRERGVTVLLVEQRAQRTVALADRTLRDRERRAAA